MTAAIPLTRGYQAMIDDADYEAVMAAGPWHANVQPRTVYAERSVRRPDGTRATQSIHTFLTGWPMVDHRDGNGLNNQRANLRPATKAQNTANTGPGGNNTSGYKGVSWQHRRNRWCASLHTEGRRLFLGYFETAKDAALAYDAAAHLIWGEYARLNLPDELAAERIDTIRARLPLPATGVTQ